MKHMEPSANFSHFRPQEAPPYLASKWLHTPFLLETKEWARLLEECEGSYFVRSSLLVQRGELQIAKEQFLENWEAYLTTIRKQGSDVQNVSQDPFALFWSQEVEAIGVLDIGQKECATQLLPTIVLQSHRFHYSKVDEEFRRQVFGKETISWGVQASFPTVFQDKNRNAIQVLLTDGENVALWRKLQRWLKENSVPVSFLINGVRKTVPFRIGYGCFSWIENHPDLRQRGLQVWLQ